MGQQRYKTLQEYAERIETLFNRHNPTVTVSADGIRYNTASTMQTGFERFEAQGMIKTEDIPFLLEKYSFAGRNLEDVPFEDAYPELEELITQLEAYNKKYEEKMGI